MYNSYNVLCTSVKKKYKDKKKMVCFAHDMTQGLQWTKAHIVTTDYIIRRLFMQILILLPYHSTVTMLLKYFIYISCFFMRFHFKKTHRTFPGCFRISCVNHIHVLMFYEEVQRREERTRNVFTKVGLYFIIVKITSIHMYSL